MHKTLYGLTPKYLQSLFVSRNDMTSYRLRNSENKLALPQPRINYFTGSFSYRGAMLWNSLSHELQSTVSLSEFRQKLRHYGFE